MESETENIYITLDNSFLPRFCFNRNPYFALSESLFVEPWSPPST